ncbi:MAG: TonB-dependent receptor, partial [candidate division KSB1 bacterium]|nr:TonB-dependent receptor [candidate division KSB1 bacterium]
MKRIAFFLLILLAEPVFSGSTGKIVGKVTDADTGEPLPGVNVVIEGTTLGAATDLNGEFFILRVPPGTVTVSASMIGYQTLKIESVRASIDKTTELRFALKPIALDLGETVTIVAERPLIERDLTSTTATVGSEVISRLPVETLQDVVNLQAGVVDGHFRGGRRGEVAYLIEGIPLNDAYSGENALQVENSAIQELQIISGTFNAEYGQAMSGIVNVVTKEGGEAYHGTLSAYVGDYVSPNNSIFENMNVFNPTYNLDASISGPLPRFGNKLTFFASGRYFDTEGHIYGKRVFLPSDSSNFPSTDVRDWYIESWGAGHRFSSDEEFNRLADSIRTRASYVPMNPNRRLSGQFKLVFRPNPSHKLVYEGLYQQQNYREYDHAFRYNPDGDYRRRQKSRHNSLNYTYVLSNRTFLTAKAAEFITDYRQSVYDDPYDRR